MVFRPRNTNAFKVSVNVAASSKITFELKYEELLQRKLGVYEIVTHINPGQVVRDFKVDVYIHESREITLLKVPPLQSATTNEISLTQGTCKFQYLLRIIVNQHCSMTFTR